MRKLLLLAGSLSLALSGWGCDMCGSSSSGSYLGILPRNQAHFVGLNYQYQTFSSTHPDEVGHGAARSATDVFQSVTAWGRYCLGKRVQLFGFVPVHYNYTLTSGQTTRMNGLGDVRLLVNYSLIRPDDSSSWKHQLQSGGGIKAPTGQSNLTDPEGIILSNMQPGTGSWDFLLNGVYTIRHNAWGLNADAQLRIPTVNRRDYLYGNMVNTGLSLFYWLEKEKFSLLPQAGFRYQWSQTDLSSHTYRIENVYSGGYQVYGSIGAGIYFNRLSLTALAHLPVKEHYAGGLVTSHNRYEVQIQYLFQN